MTDAADFAASTAAGVITTPAAVSIAAVTIGLQVAIALASKSRYLLCGASVSSAIIDGQVEPDVLGEIRNPVFQLIDRHVPQATFNVSPPTSRLQGQSSSVCRASRTRNVSFGLRPTFGFVA